MDPAVRDAARGMGYGRARLLLAVELPQALPSIVAGLRLATVTTVALVTVGVVVGYGGLGQLMFRGFRSNYHAEIMTATVLCLLLALVLRPGPRGRRAPAHPVGRASRGRCDVDVLQEAFALAERPAELDRAATASSR